MAVSRKKKTTTAEPVAPVAVAATVAIPAKLRLTSAQVVHIISAVAVLISLGTAFYFRSEYQQAVSGRDASSEIREITDTIGSFLELPREEVPTLATVTDKSKLANEAFFSAAENGDKILVYQKSRKAIIYRPSTGKLVNVAVLDAAQAEEKGAPVEEVASAPAAPVVDPTSAAANEAPVPAEEPVAEETSLPVTVALYNGSAKVGVTTATEEQLKSSFSDLVVEKKEKAAKKDYQSDIIIDLTGKHAQLVEEVAAVISATVGTLPEGEANPGTDILIIVGNK